MAQRFTAGTNIEVRDIFGGQVWSAQGRRLGVIGEDDHHRVREARDRAIALLESRGGPFAESWPHWRPDPEWELPR